MHVVASNQKPPRNVTSGPSAPLLLLLLPLSVQLGQLQLLLAEQHVWPVPCQVGRLGLLQRLGLVVSLRLAPLLRRVTVGLLGRRGRLFAVRL